MTSFPVYVILLLVVVSHVTESSVLLRRLKSSKSQQLRDNIRLQERDQRRPNVDATKFLEKFGYLHTLPPGVGHDPANRVTAIKHFQRMYHLEETGVLDVETIQAMAAPRCGMPDVKPTTYTEPTNIARRYFVPGSYKWHRNDLTYRIRNFASAPSFAQDVQRRAIERAFKYWSDVTPLTFRETREPRGDLNLEFSTAQHTDGPSNAFDGPGGVLAHAFYPENGETHFDNQEAWVDRQLDGIDLSTVAAHELGHALGLGHSAVPEALMAPYYQGYDPDFSLPQDDIDAVQSLYGPKSSQTARPTQPVTTRPAPTTTTTTTTPRPVVTQASGQPDDCVVEFQAVTQIHDNTIMVFSGSWLWRLTSDGLDNGYPVNSRDVYPFAPSNVDAAIFSRTTYYTYLFYGKTVWKYYGFSLITGQNIATRSFTGSVRDVVTDSNGIIYLIKGSSCWQFDEQSLAVHSQPVTCSSLFPSMPTNSDSTVRLVDDPTYIYLFKGTRYYKYNDSTKRMEGNPKEKAGPWMGSVCGGTPGSPK